ncbi:hypothetical protein MEQU1_001297 [Malassezia equina]|uniref:Alpha/beta hydrolase family protein n=1 Tax=Malassezia equina TaxID=1381935 RepID=A0AAF0EDU8_9BASI|nr:hypothetical protein MEQU1_001297 [Malassezia equina]
MFKGLLKKAEKTASNVASGHDNNKGHGKGGHGNGGRAGHGNGGKAGHGNGGKAGHGHGGKGAQGQGTGGAAPVTTTIPNMGPGNPNAYQTPQALAVPGLAEPKFAQAGGKSRQSVAEPSCTIVNVAGLPVYVYGLEQLTPARQGGVPEVCIAIHMHGRTGSAKKEDSLVRGLYRNTMAERLSLVGSPRVRDFLLVTFDQRNHGERRTNPLGQKSWKEGNATHGYVHDTYISIDMYGMIHGTSIDVSLLTKLLPSYLFPNDERVVSLFAVTGKSLGGHAAWQVLAHEPLIRVGVTFIGTPDFQKLLAQRTKTSDLPNAPPQVPQSLRAVIQHIDPAQMPYQRSDASNPFFGKKICSCSGEDDHLVRWSFSEEFLKSVVVAPPGSEDASRGLEIFLQPNTGHEVTSESTYGDTLTPVLLLGGRWLAQWALVY